MIKLTQEVLNKVPGFSGVATSEGFTIQGGKVHHDFRGTYDLTEVTCIQRDMQAIQNVQDSGELAEIIMGVEATEARDAGFNAYHSRQERIDNPHTWGTPKHINWDAGWLEAQKDQAEDLSNT